MTEKEQQNLISRPPVVVVLGHVDHGKSSILEAIKDLKITAKESGGITQHIGAYEIEHNGKKITFIDTPGHEAFSAIRSRGTKAADIAVLVIAGDEGVKSQTKEAISHIKKAGIPMIAAINKMDNPAADPEKIKRELSAREILVESLGGKTPSVEVSAKTGQGINDLLEMILLVAEMEDLKGSLNAPARGAVIESYLDGFRGPTATLILQEGVLKLGDVLGTNSTFGKVKILENFQGDPIKKALPSMPIVTLGFENTPKVGEEVKVYPDIETAKRNIQSGGKTAAVLPPKNNSEPTKKTLNLILKTDVLGSLEAVREVLKTIPLSESGVGLKILKAEAGAINDSDIKLAKGAKAKIIGFRVKINPIARKLALREKINIINFDVIYELVQAIRNLLGKMIEPEIVRENLGQLKTLAVFRTEKKRQIIGGKVIEGKLKRGALLEIRRNEEKIGTGKIVGLQQNKKEVEEVSKRDECGVLYEGNAKIEEGDILEAYTEQKRKIEL